VVTPVPEAEPEADPFNDAFPEALTVGREDMMREIHWKRDRERERERKRKVKEKERKRKRNKRNQTPSRSILACHLSPNPRAKRQSNRIRETGGQSSSRGRGREKRIEWMRDVGHNLEERPGQTEKVRRNWLKNCRGEEGLNWLVWTSEENLCFRHSQSKRLGRTPTTTDESSERPPPPRHNHREPRPTDAQTEGHNWRTETEDSLREMALDYAKEDAAKKIKRRIKNEAYKSVFTACNDILFILFLVSVFFCGAGNGFFFSNVRVNSKFAIRHGQTPVLFLLLFLLFLLFLLLLFLFLFLFLLVPSY